MKEQLEVTDLKGNKIGVMNVSMKTTKPNMKMVMLLNISKARLNK